MLRRYTDIADKLDLDAIVLQLLAILDTNVDLQWQHRVTVRDSLDAQGRTCYPHVFFRAPIDRQILTLPATVSPSK
jgi:hypothetical protein